MLSNFINTNICSKFFKRNLNREFQYDSPYPSNLSDPVSSYKNMMDYQTDKQNSYCYSKDLYKKLYIEIIDPKESYRHLKHDKVLVFKATEDDPVYDLKKDQEVMHVNFDHVEGYVDHPYMINQDMIRYNDLDKFAIVETAKVMKKLNPEIKYIAELSIASKTLWEIKLGAEPFYTWHNRNYKVEVDKLLTKNTYCTSHI